MDQKLASIRVLYRGKDLVLWGIPYGMRSGQNPSDLERAHDNYVPLPYGTYGSKQINLEDWVYLGSPGWYGHLNAQEISSVKSYLSKLDATLIPQNHYEWVDLADPTVAVEAAKVD